MTLCNNVRVLLKLTSQRWSSSSKKQGSGGHTNGISGTFDSDTRETHLDGFTRASNAKYMECLFAKWLSDEKSIHLSWQKYFQELVKNRDDITQNGSVKFESLSTLDAFSQLYSNQQDVTAATRSFSSKKEGSSSDGSGSGTDKPESTETPEQKTDTEDGASSFGFTKTQHRKPSSDKGTILPIPGTLPTPNHTIPK